MVKQVTFEMNGRAYETDQETLDVLREVVDYYRKTGSVSGVTVVMALGLRTGCIREIGTRRLGGR